MSLNYTLDQFGNIISTNNGMNSYADQTNSNGLKTVLFDARNSQTISFNLKGFGNMISINKSKLNYNLENKLSMFQSKDLKVNYFYDALGRRVAKKIRDHEDQKNKKSFTQTYLYLADQDKILLSKNGHGEITEYIDGLGIDEHLGEVTKEKAKSYITDHLGSVLNTEASDGRKAFSAFGDSFKKHDDEKEISKNSSAVIYGFAGRQLDSESRLYYNRARMYNTQMGKFTQKDPIGFAGGDVNLYRYVGNNPLGFTDPSGKIAVVDDAAAAIIIGGLVTGSITATATLATGGSGLDALKSFGSGFVGGAVGTLSLVTGTFVGGLAAIPIGVGTTVLTSTLDGFNPAGIYQVINANQSRANQINSCGK